MRGPQAPVAERLRERLQVLDLDLDLEADFLEADFLREAVFLREALLRDLDAGMVLPLMNYLKPGKHNKSENCVKLLQVLLQFKFFRIQ